MGRCIFCSGELNGNKIKKYNYWTIYLNENQYYLGRSYVALNRHGPESTISLNDEEWTEFKLVLDKLTNSLTLSFQVDLFNYLALQNKDRNHFHMHIIPRYEKERKFNGEVFQDNNWGKPPLPSPEKKVMKDTLNKIKKLIVGGLN